MISLVYYILQAGETSDAKAFVRELAQRAPQYGDDLIIIAQQPKQKGIEKGIQLGIQAALKKAETKAKSKLRVPCCRTASIAAPS